MSTVDEENFSDSLRCEACDFQSNCQNGLRVHNARKRTNVIPQCDGLNDDSFMEDEAYEGLKHFWKNNYLGRAYQSFIDANEVIEMIEVYDDVKQKLKYTVVETMKVALGKAFLSFHHGGLGLEIRSRIGDLDWDCV